MTFQIGEKVVYPNQGVATIENISFRNFGAQPERFYLLRLAYSTMTVIVPVSHVASIGLRPVARNQEINRILEFLQTGRCRSKTDWKCRFKENTDKMQSSNLFQVAEVLKSLLLLQQEKTLSFREKKMLDRARHLLVTEISIARGFSMDDAKSLLERSLAKAHLMLPSAL